jgi:hypothetical protein
MHEALGVLALIDIVYEHARSAFPLERRLWACNLAPDCDPVAVASRAQRAGFGSSDACRAVA